MRIIFYVWNPLVLKTVFIYKNILFCFHISFKMFSHCLFIIFLLYNYCSFVCVSMRKFGRMFFFVHHFCGYSCLSFNWWKRIFSYGSVVEPTGEGEIWARKFILSSKHFGRRKENVMQHCKCFSFVLPYNDWKIINRLSKINN